MIWNINYCEQAITGNYFEPLNSISNLFFIVAAIFLYYFYKKKGIKDTKSRIFLWLLILIGIGSSSWHFYRHPITVLLDSIPIALLFIAYVYFLLLYTTKNKKLSLSLTIFYAAIIVIFSLEFEAIGRSRFLDSNLAGYLFTLFFLVMIWIYVHIKDRKTSRKLGFVLLLFLLAIISYHIDFFICPYFKIGTHFIWHFLSAAAAYYAVRVLYR